MQGNPNSTYVLAAELMGFRDRIKLYHWTTTVYARHIATCNMLQTLDGLIDTLIEAYSGRYGRPSVGANKAYKLNLGPLTDASALEALTQFETYLQQRLPQEYIVNNDTELLNIRDEMLALVLKTKYLFTLH